MSAAGHAPTPEGAAAAKSFDDTPQQDVVEKQQESEDGSGHDGGETKVAGGTRGDDNGNEEASPSQPDTATGGTAGDNEDEREEASNGHEKKDVNGVGKREAEGDDVDMETSNKKVNGGDHQEEATVEEPAQDTNGESRFEDDIKEEEGEVEEQKSTIIKVPAKRSRQSTLQESLGKSTKIKIKPLPAAKESKQSKPVSFATPTPTRKRGKRGQEKLMTLPEDWPWEEDSQLRNEQPTLSPDNEAQGCIAFLVAFRSQFASFFEDVPSIGPQELEEGCKTPQGLNLLVEEFMVRLLSLALSRKKMIEVGRYGRALEEIRGLVEEYGTLPGWTEVRVKDKNCINNLDWKSRLLFLRQLAHWALSGNESVRMSASKPRLNPNAPNTGSKTERLEREETEKATAAYEVKPLTVIKGERYFLIQGSDTIPFRIYKCTSPFLRNVAWESVAENRQQVQEFKESNKTNTQLVGKLDALILEIDEAQVKREKEERRQEAQRKKEQEAEAAMRGEGVWSGRTRRATTRRPNYKETRHNKIEGDDFDEEEDDGEDVGEDDDDEEEGAASRHPDKDDGEFDEADDADMEEEDKSNNVSDSRVTRRSRRLRGGENEDNSFFVEIGDNDRVVGLHGQSMMVTLKYRPKQPQPPQQHQLQQHPYPYGHMHPHAPPFPNHPSVHSNNNPPPHMMHQPPPPPHMQQYGYPPPPPQYGFPSYPYSYPYPPQQQNQRYPPMAQQMHPPPPPHMQGMAPPSFEQLQRMYPGIQLPPSAPPPPPPKWFQDQYSQQQQQRQGSVSGSPGHSQSPQPPPSGAAPYPMPYPYPGQQQPSYGPPPAHMMHPGQMQGSPPSAHGYYAQSQSQSPPPPPQPQAQSQSQSQSPPYNPPPRPPQQ